VTAGQRVLAGWPVAAVPVQYDSDVGRVQRLAASAAAHQGLAPPVAQRLRRTAATMASSLATHGRAGQMLVRLTEEGERRGVELLGMDTAGNHVEAELKPAATASDLFEIYTVAGKGTVMLAQLWNGDPSDVGPATSSDRWSSRFPERPSPATPGPSSSTAPESSCW
jgi:hypothetical protein